LKAKVADGFIKSQTKSYFGIQIGSGKEIWHLQFSEAFLSLWPEKEAALQTTRLQQLLAEKAAGLIDADQVSGRARVGTANAPTPRTVCPCVCDIAPALPAETVSTSPACASPSPARSPV
jgi:hypothetical protein